MPVSKLGIEVVDSHAHFITFDTVKRFMEMAGSREAIENRVAHLTDMKEFTIPNEAWDTGQMWVDELDKYGISAIGMMIGEDEWDEFNTARKRFPGTFMGYANVNPEVDGAVDIVKRAGQDGFQGIKLYPSTWEKHHIYERDITYPIFEEAKKHKLLLILHFGVTIGPTANLRYGNPLDILRPALEFPELNFMIAHFGAGFFREVLMLMYQTPNVVMDTSGSNIWMKYQPYDLNLTKIFERALDAAASCRIAFGTDSSFFPRGFRYNILETQYKAVKAVCPQLCYTDNDINLIFKDNILRWTGFKPRK